MSATMQELLTDGGCIIRHGISQNTAAELELLNRIDSNIPNGGTPLTMQEIMDEAACGACAGMSLAGLGELGLAEMVLLNRILDKLQAPPVIEVDEPMDCAPGCIMWCNPDSYPPGLVDGNSVGIWNDESGNANHLTSSIGHEPVFRDSFYRGMNTSEFVAANTDFYKSTPMATHWTGVDRPYTLFMVAQIKNVAASGTFWACSDTTGVPPREWFIHTLAGNLQAQRLTDDGTLTINQNIAGGGAQFLTPCLITECFDGGTFRLWVNDVLLSNLAGLVTGKAFTSDWANWHIGGAPPFPPGSLWLDGYVMDVAIFDRVLSDDDRECVMENYYNPKYGLW